jgi:hypothetical protein
LAKLSPDSDFHLQLTLPAPERSPLAAASRAELHTVGAHQFALLMELLTGRLTLPLETVEARCPQCGGVTKLEGADAWNRALLSIGGYYDFCVSKLLKRDYGRNEPLIPGLKFADYDCLTEATIMDGPPDSRHAAVALALAYLVSLGSAYFYGLFRNTGLPLAGLLEFESIAHRNIVVLHHYESALPHGCQRLLAQRLLHTLLHHLANSCEASGSAWNKEHRSGPFSMIRLQELALLAKRDNAMARRYGLKHIEKVFEQQLLLIAQSLGLWVIGNQTGQRTVDLVCIPGDDTPGIFLIEAKTSGHPYSLPAKDGRALLEYAATIKRMLVRFGPLRFILLIGCAAGTNLEDKLIQLEVAVGVPIRFCIAQDIADLRESLPGPAPIQRLIDRILVGPHILPRGFATDVVRAYQTMQEAYTTFGHTMFAVHAGQLSPVVSWPDHDSHES